MSLLKFVMAACTFLWIGTLSVQADSGCGTSGSFWVDNAPTCGVSGSFWVDNTTGTGSLSGLVVGVSAQGQAQGGLERSCSGFRVVAQVWAVSLGQSLVSDAGRWQRCAA